jgi:hypothetical protein
MAMPCSFYDTFTDKIIEAHKRFDPKKAKSGAERAKKYSHNWDKADLNKVIDDVFKGDARKLEFKVNDAGKVEIQPKVEFRTPGESVKTIIVDSEGGYFRVIQNRVSTGKSKKLLGRKSMDIKGNTYTKDDFVEYYYKSKGKKIIQNNVIDKKPVNDLGQAYIDWVNSSTHYIID